MSGSFHGFCEDTFTFLLDLRFHNERSFFHAEHDRYEKVVKRPLYALAEDLAPLMQTFDEEFDTRPRMVVSHINRDVRYSKDKSPYRDHMWLSWHKSGKHRSECLLPYFDINIECCHIGMGLWDENKAGMESFRSKLVTNPSEMMAIMEEPAFSSRFSFQMEQYRRSRAPETLPVELQRLYNGKSFDVEMEIPVGPQVFEASFFDTISDGLAALKPLYQFMVNAVG